MTSDQHFGGAWTTAKLEVLRRYLAAYTTALKNPRFEKLYVDSFAGSGYRTERAAPGDPAQPPLFPDLAEDEAQGWLHGSARIALACQPRFDRYLFIERSPERCDELRALAREFPEFGAAVEIRQGDANAEIQALCRRRWRDHRAVAFLDPFGLQVDWVTIEAIAETRAIDLWLLFPLGIGVSRLVTRSGDIPEAWQRKLDAFLGTQAWREAFYSTHPTLPLFGGSEERRVKATTDAIGRFFLERLRSVFPGVADQPAVLKNSRNCPLYLLCFAVGNEGGARVALPIARHILRGFR